MDKTPSLKKNFILNAILTLSGFIFPLITFPYVFRLLLADGTGRVDFATSLIAYFNMFAQLGIPTYGIRATAKARDDKLELSRVTQELTIINLLMSVFMYACLALALLVVPRLFEDRLLYIIVSSTLLFNAVGMNWLYSGLESYSYITVRSLVFKAIAVVLTFVLVHQHSDYVVYGAITVVASVGSNIFNLIHARRYVSWRPLKELRFERHFKPIGVFFAMACATTVYTNLDSVMLGFMTTNTDVGYYGAAVKIKRILVSIITSLGAVLLPRSSYYIEKGEMEEFKKLSRKAINFVSIAAIPLVLYFILFAREGINLLSGSKYAGSIVPMQIIMPTVLFIGLTNIMGIQIMVPLGKERSVLYSVIWGAVTDLILNALLIPEYKAAGAAVGTVVAEFVVLIVQCISLKDRIRELYGGVSYTRIVLGVALGTILSVWVKWLPLNESELHSFIGLAISAICFFGTYLAVMLVAKEPFVCETLNGLIRGLKILKKKE